jgi:hypothetical protein
MWLYNFLNFILWVWDLGHVQEGRGNAGCIWEEVLRQNYIHIEEEKEWRMRYNTEICDLYDDMTVTAFIKF